jgi:DNA-directed RNA polymerase subunit RPC12/RpoP
MGILDTVRDMLVPDSESGVWYRCTACGEEFDTARERCPECGSTDIKEVEGFDMRPDT